MPLHFDLHTHSFFSGDGVSTPEEMIAAARAKGLHGFALTDHNTCEGMDYLLRKGLIRPDGLPVDGFLIIPGVEISTADGHLLCLGVTLPNMKGEPASVVCEAIHERGGLAIPPHPYDTFRAGIRESVLKTLPIDAIEVYNAATTFQFCNRRALRYAREKGFPMTAGSDAHHEESIGTAYTILDTEDFTLEGVMRQILRPNRLVQHPLSPKDKLRKTWNNWMRLRWRHRMKLKKA
ncbi:MAG: PHP domain-containing protein [Chthoniobacteraceae bacterium]|nr:PHP domain-containing protein [Chthoniobacteraceae bacterium]